MCFLFSNFLSSTVWKGGGVRPVLFVYMYVLFNNNLLCLFFSLLQFGGGQDNLVCLRICLIIIWFVYVSVFYSAGVGRTGTYIALDALYREGRNTGAVNVMEFVKKMRNNRVSMVQTYVCFKMIHFMQISLCNTLYFLLWFQVSSLLRRFYADLFQQSQKCVFLSSSANCYFT